MLAGVNFTHRAVTTVAQVATAGRTVRHLHRRVSAALTSTDKHDFLSALRISERRLRLSMVSHTPSEASERSEFRVDTMLDSEDV